MLFPILAILVSTFLGDAECKRTVDVGRRVENSEKAASSHVASSSRLKCCCKAKESRCRRDPVQDVILARGEDGNQAVEHKVWIKSGHVAKSLSQVNSCCKRRSYCTSFFRKDNTEKDDYCGWAFKSLEQQGTYSQVLQVTTKNVKEWRRDFARRTSPDSQESNPSFFVSAPGQLLQTWSRSSAALQGHGDAIANKTFVEFKNKFFPNGKWGLVTGERTIAVLSVSNLMGFVMNKSNAPPLGPPIPLQMKQTTFVVIVTPSGSVWVMLYAFVDHVISTGSEAATPYIVKLLWKNLAGAPSKATAEGTSFEAEVAYSTCAVNVFLDSPSTLTPRLNVLRDSRKFEDVMRSESLEEEVKVGKFSMPKKFRDLLSC